MPRRVSGDFDSSPRDDLRECDEHALFPASLFEKPRGGVIKTDASIARILDRLACRRSERVCDYSRLLIALTVIVSSWALHVVNDGEGFCRPAAGETCCTFMVSS